MRPLPLSPFALFLAFLIAGCGFDIDFWDERSFEIALTEDDAGAFSDVVEVDLQEHSEFQEALSKLVSVDVMEIWLEIPAVAADNAATLVSGKLELSPLDDPETRYHVATYTDLAVAKGGKVKVKWDTKGYEKLKELAGQKPNRFALHLEGAFDQLPALFTLQSRIHVVAAIDF